MGFVSNFKHSPSGLTALAPPERPREGDRAIPQPLRHETFSCSKVLRWRMDSSLENETRKWEPLSPAAISGPLDEATGRRASHIFIARGAATRHEKLP